ncbi:MAG: GroES family chaperonin [Floccifex sp.]
MLKPLHDYVLLEKLEKESATASGIILTSSKEKSKFAKVIAIGCDIHDAGYQINDEVLYREYAGTSISYQDKDYIVIKDEDIIAVNR